MTVSTVSEKIVAFVSIALKAGSPVLAAPAALSLALQIVLSGDILEIVSALFDTESSIKLPALLHTPPRETQTPPSTCSDFIISEL